MVECGFYDQMHIFVGEFGDELCTIINLGMILYRTLHYLFMFVHVSVCVRGIIHENEIREIGT